MKSSLMKPGVGPRSQTNRKQVFSPDQAFSKERRMRPFCSVSFLFSGSLEARQRDNSLVCVLEISFKLNNTLHKGKIRIRH